MIPRSKFFSEPNMLPLSVLQDILFGAAPLGPDVHAQISEKFGISRVRQAWGMSELSPGTVSSV